MPPFPALRRQDSSGSGTAPASASTPIEHVSHTPKIGGSEAVFIVLVIALATIVVASSVGIYILLRYGEPSAADRTTRRKYSIRRRGVRTHPIPIGLPGSLSEKISSVFKGRRAGTGAGWVPARDDDDDDGAVRGGTSVGEPIRERERELFRHSDFDDHDHDDHVEEYTRVGDAGASRLTALTLTDATTAGTHKSREATHVDAGAESSASADHPIPIPGPAVLPFPAAVVHYLPARPSSPSSVPTQVPDGEWLDARKDTRSSVGGGRADGSDTVRPMSFYHMPRPSQADSGQEISLFAAGTRFREDI